MKTITATVPAYMHKCLPLGELMNIAPESAVSRIVIGGTHDESWLWIGSASVTIEIADEKEIKSELVESLKEAKKKIQAEAEKNITEIDAKIQSLLAIEYKG